MSFDVFVQCFRDGKVATFERSILEEIFGPYASQRGSKGEIERVDYPDGGGGAEIYGAKKDSLTSIMFTHGGGDSLYDSIYQFADCIKGVVYWASPPPCSAVTDPETLSHAPASFLEACGPAVIAKSGAEIIAAIERD